MIAAQQAADLEKALTTGAGIVQQGDTGATALRLQFMHQNLETVSYAQEDAFTMRTIPKHTVDNNTIEWTNFNAYGGPGDGFVNETGSDGNFGVSGSDDSFSRRLRKVKYLATARTVGIVAQKVNNVTNPMQAADTGATLELIGKANLAMFNGDETLSANSFSGFRAQILEWVRENPDDARILWDAGGQPLDKAMMEDIQAANKEMFGNASLLITSVQGLADVQKMLFPQARNAEGANGQFGTDFNKFKGTKGIIKLHDDVMLRRNLPLVADGKGVDGRPRTSATSDSGALAFATTPFSACAAVAAGTGRYWNNVNLNTDTAILGTAPELPSPGYNSNSANRLPAGSYYYAVSAVYKGLESQAWVFGAGSAGTLAGGTLVTVSSGSPIVKVDIDLTGPCITGLGSTYPRNLVRWRVYRASSTAATMKDFDYLCDIGSPSSGNARGYDNGMMIPGSDNAFVITEQKAGQDSWGFYSLLPMMKRPLPHYAMGDLFAYMMFGTPILWVQRHHMWVRNVGLAT